MKLIFDILKRAKEKGFFHLLFANFIIGFAGFGAYLLVAKFLTPLQLGQIRTIHTFIHIAVIIAGFGFNTSILKMCSENRDEDEIKAILKGNLLWTGIPVVIVMLVIVLIARINLFSPDPVINTYIQWFILTIPFTVYTTHFITYLQARKKIHTMAKVQVIVKIIGVLLLVYITWKYSFSGFVFASVLISIMGLLPLLCLVREHLASSIDYRHFFKESYNYALWSVAGNVVLAIGQFIDIFLLNYLAEDRVKLGYYSLSTIFILAMSYFTTTAQTIVTPYFSEKSKEPLEFFGMVKRYQKLLILSNLGLSLFSVFFIPLFVRTVYGAEYEQVNFYFRILVLKHIFWSCYALLGAAVLGLGKMKFNFYSTAIYIPFSAVLGYFFIRNFGFTGAAVSQVIANLIALIITNLFFMKVIRETFPAYFGKMSLRDFWLSSQAIDKRIFEPENDSPDSVGRVEREIDTTSSLLDEESV